jgi:hypothetical protein
MCRNWYGSKIKLKTPLFFKEGQGWFINSFSMRGRGWLR